METTSPAQQPWQALWTRRHDVLHRAYVTYRYHRRRERFFDLVDKVSNAVTVLLAASLLGKALEDQQPLVASVISALGLMNLVFGYGDRKQTHKELAVNAMQIVGRIEQVPIQQLDEQHAGAWEVELAQLNAQEPPQLKTLVVLCEREQAATIGHPDHVPLPPWHKRLLADFKA
jgi:hypothetical protein